MFFALIIEIKVGFSHDFSMHKSEKNVLKKSSKNAEMNIFENSLDSSKNVQIEL